MPPPRGGRSRVSARRWRTRSARDAIPIRTKVRPAARIATTSRYLRQTKILTASRIIRLAVIYCDLAKSVTVRALPSGNSRSTWPDAARIDSATNLNCCGIDRHCRRSEGVAARNGPHRHGFTHPPNHSILILGIFPGTPPDPVGRIFDRIYGDLPLGSSVKVDIKLDGNPDQIDENIGYLFLHRRPHLLLQQMAAVTIHPLEVLHQLRRLGNKGHGEVLRGVKLIPLPLPGKLPQDFLQGLDRGYSFATAQNLPP